MNIENQHLDRKSLRAVTGRTADLAAVAADCVCFANAAGGRLLIGVEDDADAPPPGQRIAPELLDNLCKRIGELTVNVQVHAQCKTADNGAEYVELWVARAVGVASTSDGRYYLRVADVCKPVLGDDILALLNDRPILPWETMAMPGEPLSSVDAGKARELLRQLRASDRVKGSVKEQSDAELLRHYGLVDGDRLTNLGALLAGTAAARARLGSAPVVQAIKYDEAGQKISKWSWADYSLSPVELVDAVWREVPDFHESYELPDGLHRQSVPAYDSRVIRELLVNALVHRPYTQRGDIFLNLHPDRLEIVNPGRLPFGVTPQTLLHANRRRNPRLALVFHDLKLMESEGSGYDLMFAVQLSQGRAVPVPKERADSFSVTLGRRVLKPAVLRLMNEVDARHQLRQRERITFGLLLAAEEALTARELAAKLELAGADELPPWLGRLLDLGIVQSSGRTQGTRYFVAPALLRDGGVAARTTLRRLEPHRLKALVEEDLRRYPGSSSGDINRRVGSEVAYRTLKRAIDDLADAGRIRHEGAGRWRRYWLHAD
jgi:ATP-dependent DNA helicase RecG